MKEWKVRQQYFDMMNPDADWKDDLNKVDIVEVDAMDIIPEAIRHFEEHVPEWVYPSKSYVVAICYAHWISQDFDEDFYETLADPELLPHDPYFVPYEDDKQTYDEIIEAVTPIDMIGMVPDIYEYYREEILESLIE
jgi:hypothetical protein